MAAPADIDLTQEIAQRIDDGRRVNLRNLAHELHVDYDEVRAAYRQLAEQRGSDPLLDRARRRYRNARLATR
ncbi:MAG: hypothetical protein M0P31_17665 [Solirubrobacteraceae bacterium]|nr:hypothetical protein [Solirubrobacteraceae bacterium]